MKIVIKNIEKITLSQLKPGDVFHAPSLKDGFYMVVSPEVTTMELPVGNIPYVHLGRGVVYHATSAMEVTPHTAELHIVK